MIKLLQKRCAFQTALSLAFLSAFLGVYFGAVLAQMVLTFAGLLCALALVVWIHLVYAAEQHRSSLRDADRTAVWMLVCGYAILALSLLSFSIRAFLANGAGYGIAWGTVAASLLFASLFTGEIFYLRRIVPAKEPQAKAALLRPFLPIIVLCGILFFLNLDSFGAWFRWDSYDYCYYLANTDYAGLGLLDNLRPANHAAYGISLLYLIVGGIFGSVPFSAAVLNLLVLLISTIAFWQIVVHCFPHWKPLSQIAVTAVFGFSPFLFGLSWAFSLENFIVLGILLFLWADFKGLSFLQTIAAFMICFSKETGVVVLAAIMAIRLSLRFLDKTKRGLPLAERFEFSLCVPTISFGLVWFYDFISNSWISSNTLSIGTTEAVNFNGFGFNLTYIKDRLLSLLFSNFTWLVLLLIVAGAIVGRIRKHHTTSEARDLLVAQVLAALAAYLIPLLLFITYNHIRYAAPFALILLLLLPEALDRLFADSKLRTVTGSVLTILMLVQCYLTIDPTMYLNMDALDKGNGTILSTRDHILRENPNATNCISVSTQYNREVLYFDYAFDKLLSEIEYDDNTRLLFSNEYQKPTIGGFVASEYILTGFGYPHMPHKRYMAWDAENQTRYLSEQAEDQIRIAYIWGPKAMKDALKSGKRCIYIQFPFYNQAQQDTLFENVFTTEIAHVDLMGWKLVAYEVKA